MKFKIGKNVSGIDIEVFFESQDEIRNATKALNELAEDIFMEEIRIKAEALWITNNGTKTVSNHITDSGERVALAILQGWPNLRSNSEISSDTGLSTAAVYDHLTGRRGDKESWFRKDGDLYTFSKLGEMKIIELVERAIGEYQL